MKRLTIYRHKDCARCAKISRFHKWFDWLGRLEPSTVEPPVGGPLRMGEIAVEDARTGQVLKGVAGVRRIFGQVPLYWPLIPLLHLPPVARKIEADLQGCDDGRCAVA